MQFLYNIAVGLADLLFPVLGWFSPKMKRAYLGRKTTNQELKKTVSETDMVLWMHCASLGEFEQGRPVLEQLRQDYPQHKIVLSFFSPSGYDIRKDYDKVDAVVYLPLDTQKKVTEFLQVLHPNLALFVKYEIWPNLLKALSKERIDTLLISGIFRANQHFFTKKAAWYREPLKAFSHFFVQDQQSVDLLNNIGIESVTLAGDTRFDRVHKLVAERQHLKYLDAFCTDKHILVLGSSWQEDEDLLLHYINSSVGENEKFIIAPHEIKQDRIRNLMQSLKVESLLYSEADSQSIKTAKVLIIDSIGKLTSVYAYAHVAYVGGGFGNGIHNILEPAAYGLPILIGPKYDKFIEAVDLVLNGSCLVVHSNSDLEIHLQLLRDNKALLTEKGELALNYVKQHTGATKKIIHYIKQLVCI